MIVKNGAATLARCLESARNLVDDIVIGDTGSDDATGAIARDYGARIVNVPWNNDFSQARNAVLQHGAADWVLSLDADEMLDSEASAAIPPLLSRENVWGYEVAIWNYVRSLATRFWDRPAKPNPGRVQASVAYPAYLEHRNVRLFRRHLEIRFENRVHEGVADSLARKGYETASASFVIHHFGIAEDDAATRARKVELYQALGREKIREAPDDALAHFELGIGELEHFRNPAAALACFQRVVELNPRSPRGWTFAGICLVRLGRHRAGLEQLQHAQHLGAGGAVLLEAQGDAFYHLENIQEARNCYRAAREQGGQSAILESKLGVCEVRLGFAGQGLGYIADAIAREPESPELHDILVTTALLAGDLVLAAKAVNRRLALGKLTPEVFLIAARIQVRMGDWVRVQQTLQDAYAHFPGEEKLHLAMAEVSKLTPAAADCAR